jgi:hypothetical protein
MKNNYKFWTVLSLIVVFLAGVASGVLVDKHILVKKQKARTEKPDSKKRQPVPYPALDLMADELNLTIEQREKMREIFKNNEERFKKLRKDQYECLKDIRSQLNKEIKSVLTEEQQAKYEAMIEKYRSQRNRDWEDKKRQSDRKPSDKGEKK